MNIGNAIKTIRKKRGLTQGQLSDEVGMSTNAICNIETAKAWPPVETLNKIANALNVPQSYILLFSIEEEDVPEDKRLLFRILAEPLKKGLLE